MSAVPAVTTQRESIENPVAEPRRLPVERRWQVEILRGGSEIIEQLAAEWQALCREGNYNKPFYRPEWFRAFLHAFAPEKQLWLVTIRGQGRLAAILPLIHEQDSVLGLRVNRLCGLANDHSPRFDMIHGPSVSAQEAAAEVWRVLAAQAEWDIFKAPNVPVGGAFEWILRAAAQDGYPTGRWESLRSPFIALPETGDLLTARVGDTNSKFRANIRRRKRKLTHRGMISLRRIDKADPAFLEKFYCLEQSGWKGRTGSAINCRINTRKFYDALAREAESQRYLSLYFLEVDGHPVAGHFGLAHEGVYYCSKVGYDERWHTYSPGQLLVEAVLRDCMARGLHEFDFVGPEMEWKTDWTSRARSHAWCFVYARSLKARLLHGVKFRLISLAKQLLGRGLDRRRETRRAEGSGRCSRFDRDLVGSHST